MAELGALMKTLRGSLRNAPARLRQIAGLLDEYDEANGNPDHTAQEDMRRWADAIEREFAPLPEGSGDYDEEAYQKADRRGRLRLLCDAIKSAATDHQRTFIEGRMLELTVDMDEHPEWFDRGCLCYECRTSG